MPGPSIEQQREWWDEWIAKYRNERVGSVSERQAQVALRWLADIQNQRSRDLDIIDVGCGSGWLCERLGVFGSVTGTDLAEEAIMRARERRPDIRYEIGDFLALNLGEASFDVAVSLEVLSHVDDQSAFMQGIARLLRPGGYLLLFNQNRWVLERNRGIQPQGEGQLRKWTSRRDLRRLAKPHFEIEELTTLSPRGDRGLLRWINAPKLNRLFAAFVGGQANLDRIKERLGFGWTLAMKALVRPGPN